MSHKCSWNEEKTSTSANLTCGLLDEDHVGNPVPRVGILRKRAIRSSAEWTLFAQEASKACSFANNRQDTPFTNMHTSLEVA